MGSSNQNETRKEHRLRDMPPLGPMQKNVLLESRGLGLLFNDIDLTDLALQE